MNLAAPRRRRTPFLLAPIATAIFLAALPSPADPPPASESRALADSAGLHHVFQVDPALYSGCSPVGDAAFARLAELGVKMIISVDGAKPAVELARRHGLRYVHLPIGYDGIPAGRAAQLLKAASVADGPVYVHCHHGKHRGPAAAAIIMRGLKGWSSEQAAAWLQRAGTGPEYAGLHRDARNLRPPSAQQLAAIETTLPEIAATPPLVDRMVAIDGYFERIKAAEQSGWSSLQKTGRTDPATMLREELREARRDPGFAERGPDYARLHSASEDAVARLRDIVTGPVIDESVAKTALKEVSASCTTCHRAHRN